MEDPSNAVPGPPAQPRRRRWPLIAGASLAFALALGVGAFIGSTIGAAHAASPQSNLVQNVPQFGDAATGTPAAGMNPGGPGGQGGCQMFTVSSVSGQTITAKAADGTTVTINVTSSTKILKNGTAVALSTITSGTSINVMGTHNSDGSITATEIDVR
jgi:hypothetical protein